MNDQRLFPFLGGLVLGGVGGAAIEGGNKMFPSYQYNPYINQPYYYQYPVNNGYQYPVNSYIPYNQANISAVKVVPESSYPISATRNNSYYESGIVPHFK